MNNKFLYMLILLILLVIFPLVWSWYINIQEGLEIEKSETHDVKHTEVDGNNVFKQLQMLADGSPVIDILDQTKVDEHSHGALEQGQTDLKESITSIQNMLNSPDIKAIQSEANDEGSDDANGSSVESTCNLICFNEWKSNVNLIRLLD